MSEKRRRAVLVASCDNYREDVDRPCTGTLRYRWGQSGAGCDVCGGIDGIAVANWERVEFVPEGTPDDLRNE